MYGHGCKLKRLLRPAVEAYLDERTCTLAAQRAGIARSTLFVWIKLPAFRRMVERVLYERVRQRPAPVGCTQGGLDVKFHCGMGSGGNDRQTGAVAAYQAVAADGAGITAS